MNKLRSGPKSIRPEHLALGGVLLLALLLRLSHLTESLWYDELWSTRLKLDSLRGLARTVLGDVHPPAYSVLMFAWTRLFGDSELSVRIPPLLFALGTIHLTWLLARRWTDGRTALLAASLLALSPVHIWYSQEARQYSALLFCVLLWLLSHAALRERGLSLLPLLGYLGAAAFAVFGHYYAPLLVLLLSVFILRYPCRDPRATRTLLAVNLGLVLAVAGFLALKHSLAPFATGPGHLRPFTLVELPKLLHWFVSGNALWTLNPYAPDFSPFLQQPLMLLLYASLAALLARGLLRLAPGPSPVPLLLVGLPACLLLISALGVRHLYIERSALVLLPLFLIVLAAGALAFRHPPAARGCAALLLVVSAVTLGAFFLKRDYAWTVYKPKADWRAAAGYLSREFARPGSRHLVLASTPATVLTYYDRALTEAWDGRRASPNPQILYVRAHDLSAAADPSNGTTVYLVHQRYWSGAFPELLDGVRGDPRFRQTAMVTFRGLEIYRFEGRASGAE